MTDKEKLLGRVRMYDFALVEVSSTSTAIRTTLPRSNTTTKCARRLTRPPPSTRTRSVR